MILGFIVIQKLRKTVVNLKVTLLMQVSKVHVHVSSNWARMKNWSAKNHATTLYRFHLPTSHRQSKQENYNSGDRWQGPQRGGEADGAP